MSRKETEKKNIKEEKYDKGGGREHKKNMEKRMNGRIRKKKITEKSQNRKCNKLRQKGQKKSMEKKGIRKK